MTLLDKLFSKDKVQNVAALVDSMFDTDKDISRRILERIWWRNLLYYSGEQWIEWVRGTSSFRRRILYGQQVTPVSNEIRDFVRAVKSMLLNQRMVPRVVPNTNERGDIDAAEMGEALLEYMDSTNDYEIEDEKEKAAITVATCGTAFLRTIPFKAGGRWFIQKDGSVLTTGDVITENILPFNVIVDKVGDTMRKKAWIGIQSLRSKEWVEDTFKIKVSGEDSAQAVDYQRKLMTLVGQVSPWKGSGLDYVVNDAPDDTLITMRELEFQPTLKYPDGRYIITCGGKVLQTNDRLPIAAEKGQWQYSPVDFHWNYMPGRFWSDSGVDDLISPQNMINEIDKAFAENRKSLGRTTVVLPNSSMTLTKLSEKDDPILVLSYDGMASGGARPVFQQGIALTNQHLDERAIHKVQIQEMGGDPKNVLKGQAPSAHASGVMTDILRETAERGHYPDMDRYNRSMSRVYKCRLLVAKEVYTEERMIKVKGRGNHIKVMAFKSSDLRGNTDVRMEIDSGLATTKAGQRATLMDLLKLGLFPEITTDPTMKQEIIRRFGFSGISVINNIDIERAERENSIVASGSLEGIYTVTPPVTPDSEIVTDDPLFIYDNNDVHYEVHRRFILDPQFSELPVQIQAGMIIHNNVHNLRKQAAQADAMKQAMLMGAAGKGGGTGGGMPSLPLETGSEGPPEGAA